MRAASGPDSSSIISRVSVDSACVARTGGAHPALVASAASSGISPLGQVGRVVEGLEYRILALAARVGEVEADGAGGKVVGPTVGEQTGQAFRDLTTILESEGASLANIVHWRIAVVDGHPFDEGVAAFQEVWNRACPPPAITVHVVAGLSPGFLVEIDAVAVV
jgi:enamine deaminase RidA (YjgF/YER057c/UK114 family)